MNHGFGLLACLLPLWGALAGCGGDKSSGSTAIDTTGTTPRSDTSGTCTAICDATTPSYPVITDSTSYGDITTYGGTDTTITSSGGACNYGVTAIRHYAAIQVNELPGDLKGQWKGGKVCGQGVRVRARTDSGWKETYVRIMDKCPDGYCGIDLGGAPAHALMGTQAGRYSGEWSFVSCRGHAELFDRDSHLWIKDGSNPSWALVQVRDPYSAVTSLRYRLAKSADTTWLDMPWATEAENFFRVPDSLLVMTDSVDILVSYSDTTTQRLRLAGSDLSAPKASYTLR